MNKYELVEDLQTLDEKLSSSFDIILIGGAAMILHFGAKRATSDVDILILRGDWEKLHQAIKEIAIEHNLPENWMNDAAKGFVDIFPPDFYHRLVPLSFKCQHLRFYALGNPEQVAMKIIALREQDIEDLELLLPKLSEEEKKILITIAQHINNFRSDWAQKIFYFLQEQGWEID